MPASAAPPTHPKKTHSARRPAEDTELPNASEPPPEPSRVAAGRLPLDQQAVLLEAWQFVARFGEQLLGFQAGEALPTLQDLEAALLGEVPPPPPPEDAMEVEGGEPAEPPQAPPSAAVRLQCALLDFLVGGLFNETAAAITGGCRRRAGRAAECSTAPAHRTLPGTRALPARHSSLAPACALAPARPQAPTATSA